MEQSLDSAKRNPLLYYERPLTCQTFWPSSCQEYLKILFISLAKGIKKTERRSANFSFWSIRNFIEVVGAR